jgi:16S rRNA (adenine1518-N6/adenine1519-N6)-dimethyltransferase
MVTFSGIPLKKKYGQHFLRNQMIVDHMIEAVDLNDQSSVFEIGCGDGFLTRSILKTPIARLWVFEIDRNWVDYIKKNIQDSRLTIHHENFLDIDWQILQDHQPWIVLANLPYQVTFPILYAFQRHRHMLKEGVVMVQEEVAQKIVKQRGRGFGYVSVFLQYYFDWKLLDKVSPTDFYPPPKVYSRLLYFKPKENVAAIPHEQEFWKFIKVCFHQPRRTLRNNLKGISYNIETIDPDTLQLRAQQLSMDQLLVIWKRLVLD